MRRIAIIIFVFAIGLVGCNLNTSTPTPTQNADLVGTMVAATLSAVPTLTSLPEQPTSTPQIFSAPSPTAKTGMVSGKVCYPSGANAMTAYFEATDTHAVKDLPISGGESTYTLALTPGSYLAYAWLNDFSLGGSYSKCGATADCNDAKPIPFIVNAGQDTTGVDLCDWTHGPFDIPYPPGYSPSITTGIISGSISGYPYGDLPTLTIVAFNQGSGYWYWVGTAAGQTNYTISELPPGTYQVVAYDGKNRSGGSSLITVTAGQTANAVIDDWSGSYPDNPVH